MQLVQPPTESRRWCTSPARLAHHVSDGGGCASSSGHSTTRPDDAAGLGAAARALASDAEVMSATSTSLPARAAHLSTSR
jgi:hypothetical protein